MLFLLLFLLHLGLCSAATSRIVCPPFQVPAKNSTKSNSKLPDPFTFLSGEKVTNKADWECRRTEISAILQDWELGTLPPKPSYFNATIVDGNLAITTGEANRRISFNVSVSRPVARSGPFPAIIALGGVSIPVDNSVFATITFNNDQMAAQQNSAGRGQGKFYDLYGSNHSAGALMAWTWGVSRVIDALELLGNRTKIDTKRLAVTGCSRNGKGALVIGAFEDRIALTIPQEAGVGGPAIWRLYNPSCRGICIPEWTPMWDMPYFRRGFPPSSNLNLLPYDHHELIGLVAPRGLYVAENNIDWLNPEASAIGAKAGRTVYEALGVKDRMGFSLAASHNHCLFPANQGDEIVAFYNRFLRGRGNATTDVWRSNFTADASRYIDWDTPDLS